jgi:hypothetical protein
MTTHALLKLRRTLRAAFYLSVASIIVTPAEAQQQEQPIAKLECEGLLRSASTREQPVAVSGVLVEIYSNRVVVFGLYGLPDFQTGLLFEIFNRNPAMIFMRTRDNIITANISRLSGELNLVDYGKSGPYETAKATYNARCANPRAVF